MNTVKVIVLVVVLGLGEWIVTFLQSSMYLVVIAGSLVGMWALVTLMRAWRVDRESAARLYVGDDE
jgi:putative effector of murein hydrolase LrgA (UPF0299 family)